jgi:hypothetical protein
MENRKNKGRLALVLALALLLLGAVVLGAQEGPPGPPEGLTFSGSVITGLRWRSTVQTPAGYDETTQTVIPATYKYNVFDIEAADDFLSSGDTAALRAALNKGFYGLNFGLMLNANNTLTDKFWVTERIYVSEASLWAKFLENKAGVKAGYYADFDYFSPVNAWSLGANSAVQLTAYPIQGLQIDVKSRVQPANNVFGNWADPVWYEGEQWVRNIDVGVKYVNPTFTAFVAFDDDAGAPPIEDHPQIDVFGYFAFTGVPKLTVGVESKFLDLTSERPDPADGTKDIGITNVTALNASYQITDALSARAWIVLGASTDGLVFPANELLGADGFSMAVDLEGTYKLNDAWTFSLRPIFSIPNTEDADIFDISVRPKAAWTLATGPYAATINFSYKLRVFGENGINYLNNNSEALNHAASVTFGWTF